MKLWLNRAVVWDTHEQGGLENFINHKIYYHIIPVSKLFLDTVLVIMILNVNGLSQENLGNKSLSQS